jgi:hypothetical protein
MKLDAVKSLGYQLGLTPQSRGLVGKVTQVGAPSMPGNGETKQDFTDLELD